MGDISVEGLRDGPNLMSVSFILLYHRRRLKVVCVFSYFLCSRRDDSRLIGIGQFYENLACVTNETVYH